MLIVGPVFGLIGLGYIAGWVGAISPSAGNGLSEFVFVLAVPALIFRTMATAALPAEQPWGYWFAYFLAVCMVWTSAMFISRHWFAVSHGESVMAGFCAGQSNTVLVGVPLILKAFGEAGAVPLFLLIAVHLPLVISVATLLIEGPNTLRIGELAGRLLVHPVLVALFCGVAWRLTGWGIGGAPRAILDGLAAAAIPCSLVALGLALRRHGFAGGLRLAATLSTLKLVVHPALVYVFAFKIFAMPAVWAGVAVLFAAMPCGINSYVFAERYHTGVAITSSAIALSTLAALFTTVFWLWALGITTG
jgi:malonate transporter